MPKKKEKIQEQQPEEVIEIPKETKEEKEITATDSMLKKEEETRDKSVEAETIRKDEKEEKKEKEGKRREAGRRRGRWEKEPQEFVPRTKLGKLVKQGKIKDINEIFDKGIKIMEAGIVDTLLPGLNHDLIAVGQSKGKFGGGKRRAWRQTQKKTAEENVPSFSCMAVVGDGNSHVGLGMGKARETLPAREKALRKAKLNIIRIQRGCGSFDCGCNEQHSIPFTVEGKCGSARIKLMPAAKGTGLAIEDECKKILRMAGISDIYSRTEGQTKIKFNLATACMIALEKTTKLVK